MQVPNTFRGGPDERGHFGLYGGRYVAETLMPLVLAVEAAYGAARGRPGVSGRARLLPRALCRPAEPAYISPSG